MGSVVVGTRRQCLLKSSSLTIESTTHLEAGVCCVRAELGVLPGAVASGFQRRGDVLLATVCQDEAHLDERRPSRVAQRQHDWIPVVPVALEPRLKEAEIPAEKAH